MIIVMAPHARSLVLGAIAIALASGCPRAELGLSLDVKTDLVPGTEFGAVRTELFRESPSATSAATGRFDVPALRTDDFVAGQRVAEFAVETGAYWARLRVLASDGHLVAERIVSVRITASQSVVVVITRSCASITCTTGQTCVGGACIDPDCTGASCPAECMTVSECATMASCAVTQCIDRACFYGARAGGCAATEWCNPSVGCVRDPTAPDAGPPSDGGGIGMDAGRDAGPGCMGSCAGRSCGDDGCGGSCGSCGPGTTCDGSNCVCARDCSGRSCGDDGCGGSCGSCSTGFTCDGSGACQCGGLGAGCASGSCCGSLACTGGACCAPVGQTCGGASECCPGRACQLGVCCVVLGDGCSSDPQCCNGHNCLGGICCVSVGMGCSSGTQCCTGVCTAGTCR